MLKDYWQQYSPLAVIVAVHLLVTVILALGLAPLPGWQLGALLVNALVGAIAVCCWPLEEGAECPRY